MTDEPRNNKANMVDLKPAERLPEPTPPALRDTGTEIAVSMNAATAKAMVEVRYLMALRQPRIMDVVRQDILTECRRPAFAHNKSAYYVKPIGDGAEGLGIRFAEVAIRCMKNVLIQTSMQYEDAEKEVHKVTVTDLEANVPYEQDVRVSKAVERSRPAEDGTFISKRKNSRGYWTYTVIGTEDDMLNKRAAQISKTIRTLALRIIPGGIQDEAEEVIKAIRLKKATDDPQGERKAIADGFLEVGVPAGELIEFLGHGLDTCSPHELVKLRGIFGAIRNGEATWAQVVENENVEREKKPPPKGKSETVADKAHATDTVQTEGGTPPNTPPPPVETKVAEPPREARKRRPAASME